MDQESRIKRDLLNRPSRDLHVKFFQQDPFLQYIKVPTVFSTNPSKYIVPFRNTGCLRPDCIYDLQDLVDKCRKLGYKYPHGFTCNTCHNYIEFKNFFLDIYLRNIMETLNGRQNGKDKASYESIIVRRNGSWQAISTIPEKQAILPHKEISKQKNVAENSTFSSTMSSSREGKMFGNSSSLENVPHLSGYNQAEYEQYTRNFEEKFTKDCPLLKNDNDLITSDDIIKLESDEGVTPQVMGIFANYLNKLQKENNKIYNRKNRNRSYIAAIKVNGFNTLKKQVKYNFLARPAESIQNFEELYDNHDRLILILDCDQRWIAVVLDLSEMCLGIADFLSEEISQVQAQELFEIVKNILRTEFAITYQDTKIYDLPKLNFISDCGLYVLSFVYKSLNNAVVDNIRITFLDKDLFRRQIVWLLLKMINNQNAQDQVQRRVLQETSNVLPVVHHKRQTSLQGRQAYKPEDIEKTGPIRSYNILSEAESIPKPAKNLNSSNPKPLISVKSNSDTNRRSGRFKFSNLYSLFNVFPKKADVSGPKDLTEISNNIKQIKFSSGVRNMPSSLQDLDNAFSLDTEADSQARKVERAKERVYQRQRIYKHENNPRSDPTSPLHRHELKDILSHFKNDLINSIKQEINVGQYNKVNYSTTHREDQSRRGLARTFNLPNIHSQPQSVKSFTTISCNDLSEQSIMLKSKKTPVIGYAGTSRNETPSLNTSVNDDLTEKSPSIILFAFQEENQAPKRLNVQGGGDKERKPATLEKVKEDDIKKGVKKDYQEEEEGGLFDYVQEEKKPEWEKSPNLINESQKKLKEIRESEEEESPF